MEKNVLLLNNEKSCLNLVKKNYDGRNKNEKCYIALKNIKIIAVFILRFQVDFSSNFAGNFQRPLYFWRV